MENDQSTPQNSPLYTAPDFAQFYDLENRWAPDFTYCANLAKSARTVLDLGCGTGELAVALAQTCVVTAVDPANAMLDIARARDTETRVTWVQGDARTLKLNQTFDLIVLTGHAFQVLLTDADQLAALKTIHTHLSNSGRFIFDMRNKSQKVWQVWAKDKSRRHLTHATLGKVTAWAETTFDPATSVATYTTTYETQSSGKQSSTPAHIRFSDQPELAAQLSQAGLIADQWLGDWHGSPWTPTSKEIIPVGRKA